MSIIGPNGAGKSTLLALLSRLLPATSGSVHIDELDVAKAPSDVRARRLSILRQDNHPVARLTVRDLVAFGRFPHSRGRLAEEDEKRISESIRYMELESLADRFLNEMSGGQRQCAFVAMVLCQDTDYVLLDEPLNNLDMRHATGMMKLVRRVANELGQDVRAGFARYQFRIDSLGSHRGHARRRRDQAGAAIRYPADLGAPGDRRDKHSGS